MTSEKNLSQEHTEEEMKAKKQELIKFYKDQLPLLKLQAEYEETITRIEAAKMTRMEIMLMKHQMMNPPSKGKEKEPTQENSLKEEHTIPKKEKDIINTEK